jgi:choline/glycine/proline betaine transport protein
MSFQSTDSSNQTTTGKHPQKFFDIHGPVFWPSVILILVMIATTFWMGDRAVSTFNAVQSVISNTFGWMFILSVSGFLIFSLSIAFSKLGHIRLGGHDAQPEFSISSWFAMLFSAGMGIGIMFWSVAEPVYHYLNPPMAQGETVEAARQAMSLSYLHWGFHAWGIYTVVGLSLAFFAFNKGLPLSFRSVFYPVLGDRINSWMGDVVDTLAILATLFGLATSLGFGVRQVTAGLNYLFNAGGGLYMQVGLIAGITAVATLSVVLGIDKGVRVLSEANIRIAVAFLVFMIAVGPTIYILDSFVQNTGHYLNNIFRYSFWTESYKDTSWQHSWTVFYWAWWISWSPYVGMFIAKISKGRTVREFILGVLIAPSLVTFLWLTAFGGSAINLEIMGVGNVGSMVQQDYATALFAMLEQFPLSFVTSMLAIVLVMSFFVTSSDSGSLVIDSITSGGKLDAPVGQRVFWAVTEGAVAAVLLIGGGLEALQTAAISSGLPFMVILILMCYSVYRGLRKEYREKTTKIEKERGA